MPIVKGNNRRRYIGFVIKSFDNLLNRSEVIKEIQRQCRDIFNKNCKEMDIRLIKFNGSYGIIQCNYKEKENTIMLLKSIKRISTNKVKIKTIATSGTIRSLINKHMTSLITIYC